VCLGSPPIQGELTMEDYLVRFVLAAVVAFGALVGAVVGIALARIPASTRLLSVLRGAVVGVSTLVLFAFIAVLVLAFQFDWSANGVARHGEGESFYRS